MKLYRLCVFPVMSIVLGVLLMSCSTTKPIWHNSIYNGHNDAARDEIKRSKDIKSVTMYGDNSLLWAASIGDVSLVVYLLSIGAEIDFQNKATGDTPLLVAAKNGHTEVLKVLMKQGASKSIIDKNGNDAISAAIGAGKIEVIPALIEAGFRLDTDKSNKLLVIAASLGDVKTVQKLLESGAPVNFQTNEGETALIASAKSGNAELVRFLITRGAKVETKDSAGRTALILASQSGYWSCCKVLIESGADFNTNDFRGNTPIMWAIIMGKKEAVTQLIRLNADVSKRNAANKNALFLAAFDMEIAKSILRVNNEIPDVTVEADNYFDLALTYKSLGSLLEGEIIENAGVDVVNFVGKAKVAYQLAAKHFDSTASQYEELATSIRKKKVLSFMGTVLLNATIQIAASYDAQQKAHQMAEINMLSSAAHGGPAYGEARWTNIYPQVSPDTSTSSESAKTCDIKASELKRLAALCRKKVDCYDNIKSEQTVACVNTVIIK